MSTSLEIYKEVINTYFPESYFWTKETVPYEHRSLFDKHHSDMEIQQYLKSRYAYHLKTQADRALVKLATADPGVYANADVTALKVLLESSGILDMQYQPQTITVTHYIPSPYADMEEGETHDITALT